MLVGVTGFEPAASWSRTKRTTKLCHTPREVFCFSFPCAIGEGTEPPNAALRLRLRTYQTVPHPEIVFLFFAFLVRLVRAPNR